MWEKLKQLARRYDEIGELLEVPEIYADPKKLRALTREQKELLKQLESSVGDDGQPKRKSFFDKLHLPPRGKAFPPPKHPQK